MVKRIALAVLTFCLASTVICQSADDDEVGGTYPGYPHTFYSGISNFIKAISSLTFLPTVLSTMFSSPLSKIKLKTRSYFGSQVDLVVQACSPASMKMGLLLSSQEQKIYKSTLRPGTIELTCYTLNCLQESATLKVLRINRSQTMMWLMLP